MTARFWDRKGELRLSREKTRKRKSKGDVAEFGRQPQKKVKHFSSFIWPSLKLIAPPFRRCSAIRRSKGSLSLAFPVHASVKFLMLVTCLIDCPKVAILNQKSPSYAFFVGKKGKYSKKSHDRLCFFSFVVLMSWLVAAFPVLVVCWMSGSSVRKKQVASFDWDLVCTVIRLIKNPENCWKFLPKFYTPGWLKLCD